MTSVLLATKLLVPRPPSRIVRRDRLLDRLDSAGESALTLVSAPAGSGKTALVSAWLDERGQSAAWLSLDEGDNDPARFWSYLIAALRTLDGGLAESALQLLRSPQPPSSETVATIVINDLAAATRPVVCVLDDYHVIDSEPLHSGLGFLVEHLPPNAHLIVTTRADPPWALARLRASDRLVELRAADLRFTDDEARRLVESSGLTLRPEDVETLQIRTEGWIAGLQMAALSMRDRADTAAFIRDFAGSHRFVLDYLAEEVLSKLPDDTRTFLVRTSILEALNGELCDEVTGLGQGQDVLESLEQANLFIEQLDDERRWYRYHQLFADVLRSQLVEEDTELVRVLHARASRWFEEHGLRVEAVHHVLEAGDIDRASRLIAASASATFMVTNQLLLLDWLDRLGEEAVAAAPLLALARAWARFVIGDYEQMVPALEVASTAIERAAGSPDGESLQAQLEGIRSWVSYQTGDLEGCVESSTLALSGMPDDGLVPRRIVAIAQAYGLLLLGQVEAARQVAERTRSESRHVGDALTECLAIALDGQAYLLAGQLERAERAYERAVAAGTVAGEPLPSVCIAQVQLAEVVRERNALDSAQQMLDLSISACERAMGLSEWVFEGNVTLARVLAAQGDAALSRETAEQAERGFDREIVPAGMEPLVGRALCYRLRYWLLTGEVDRASTWLHERGVSVEGSVDPSQRPFAVLLVKTLLAQGEPDRALRLAGRLTREAGDELSLGQAVELAIVEGLAHQEIGEERAAAESIVGALRIAEPEGYVRLFADEGTPMVRLLESAAPLAPQLSGYIDRLTSAIATDEHRADAASNQSIDLGSMVPLSERELALLRMFAVGRSNREIADELYLSINTVKWHARRIYEKLGVNRRSLAVARARELGIL